MAKCQFGKCVAVYRAIPSMHLQDSNIACTFVQSGYPQNQSKFLKKVKSGINSCQGSKDDLTDNDLGKHSLEFAKVTLYLIYIS